MAQDLAFHHIETAEPVPAVERAFLRFSIALTALQLLTFVKPLRPILEAITPYGGWVFGLPYLIACGMWPSIYHRPVRTFQTLRVTLSVQCLILLIYAAYGIADFVMFHDLRDDPNPMLRYSPLRPIWTVAIPIVWTIALWRARPPRETQP